MVVQPGITTTGLVYPADHGQRHPWMVERARALSGLGLSIVTFNFLYTEHGRRMPDRRPLLDACYRAVIDAVRREVAGAGEPLFIGGKSMGGRIATHVAADDRDMEVQGLVLLGYPLHPPGKPEERRDAHLPAVGRPMLFVQGSRDTFGTPDELQPVLATLSPRPALHVVPGGDHSFKVPKKNQAAVFDDVQRTIVEWVRAHGSTHSLRSRQASAP